MVRLLASVFNFRVESISVTLTLRSQRFRTQRAQPCVFLAVGGSHTDEQYSRVGRTRALYAVSLVLGGQCIKFRFGKPRVLLALLKMVLICSFQRRSSDRDR